MSTHPGFARFPPRSSHRGSQSTGGSALGLTFRNGAEAPSDLNDEESRLHISDLHVLAEAKNHKAAKRFSYDYPGSIPRPPTYGPRPPSLPAWSQVPTFSAAASQAGQCPNSTFGYAHTDYTAYPPAYSRIDVHSHSSHRAVANAASVPGPSWPKQASRGGSAPWATEEPIRPMYPRLPASHCAAPSHLDLSSTLPLPQTCNVPSSNGPVGNYRPQPPSLRFPGPPAFMPFLPTRPYGGQQYKMY